MKRQIRELSRRYEMALHRHLQQGQGTPARLAQRLGQQALKEGLETLDLARIHKAALATLQPPANARPTQDRMAKRAGTFFSEAITPIEKSHRASVQATASLRRRNKTLARRTAQLAAARLHLKKGIARRKAAEVALTISDQCYAKLLEKSRRLQRRLQEMTHCILYAQEEDRTSLSYGLRDEIGQTLLGINVRLLALKKCAAVPGENLAEEIGRTQKLVERSFKSIDLIARDRGVRHDR